MTLLKKLFIGPQVGDKPCKNAILAQAENVKNVWNNISIPTFGIERIIKLILTCAQFAFPALYIRYFFGRYGILSRKIGNEIYTLIKVIFPIILILYSFKTSLFAILIFYFGIETILYTANIFFLQGIYTSPISNKRSLILGMINYLEIIIDFSYLYYFYNSLSNISDKFDYFYFSVITSATIGFGDIIPISNKSLVVIQIFISLFFTLFLLGYFLQNISNTNVWHDKKS